MKRFPYENVEKLSAEQVYFAIVKDLKDKGITPEKYNEMFFNSKANSQQSGGMTKQRIELKEGDLVRIRSNGKIGRIKKIIKRNVQITMGQVHSDSKYEAEIEVDEELTKKYPMKGGFNGDIRKT